LYENLKKKEKLTTFEIIKIKETNKNKRYRTKYQNRNENYRNKKYTL